MSPNSSNVSFLPSKIAVFVAVGFDSADDTWGRCCDAMPATASTSVFLVLSESEFCLRGECPTIGNLLSSKT